MPTPPPKKLSPCGFLCWTDVSELSFGGWAPLRGVVECGVGADACLVMGFPVFHNNNDQSFTEALLYAKVKQ